MDALYHDVLRSVELTELVVAEIRAAGPMTFARFMELALYHPSLGYYPTHPDATTRAGDFLTAPETHPVFGELLARFCGSAARELDARAFTVVEQGPGTGALAESLTRCWREIEPERPLRYIVVEPGEAARARLRARLGDAVEVRTALEPLPPFVGVYLSNELPDAFPVHRLRRRDGDLCEVYLALDGERLVEVEGPLSSHSLARWLDEAGIHLLEGSEIEASPGVEPWLAGVAAVLERGYVLTIDYGYDASEASRFPRGTLLAHYRHGLSEDFVTRIGMQDLTSHVCWTALERIGGKHGLRTVERLSQRDFLTRWGWKDYGRRRLSEGAPPRELDAIDRLGRPDDGLGGFGVLLQAKGMEHIRLGGALPDFF